jgi:tetratricopeptide (TPR) repeat protein
MDNERLDTLRATAFEPQVQSAGVEQNSQPARQTALWVIVTIGSLLLLLVVFVLPSLAPAPPLEPTVSNEPREPRVQSQVAAQSQTPQSERSPFAEAQLAKTRRAAQEVLQALLETQSRLENRAVDQWGNAAFLAASALAIEGDEYYRTQDFSGAEGVYQTALDALVVLEGELTKAIEARLTRLLIAIEGGDLAVAQKLAPILRTMAPDSDAILDASERVSVMPEIITYEETAQAHFDTADYQRALTDIRAALLLDPVHQRLSAIERDYDVALTQQQFEEAMTRGFAALTATEFSKARAAFERAKTHTSNASDVAGAFAQLKEAETLSSLNRLLSQAADLQANEEWADAFEAYEQALALDSSLVEASEGIIAAESMATLFQSLSEIVEKQARLVDEVVLNQAKITLIEAEKIVATSAQSMPKLVELVDVVRAALSMASTPLPVSIFSDGLTEITLKRVARLGTLTSRTLSLRPGQYQLLGSREGYRDVLVTLNIKAGADHQIDIRCKEIIAR